MGVIPVTLLERLGGLDRSSAEAIEPIGEESAGLRLGSCDR